MPANETAAATDWTARARAKYLDPDATVEYVERHALPRHRLGTARSMLAFTANPRHTFGLTAEDIPASVVYTLQGIIDSLRHVDEEVRALALCHRDLERRGFAQDEIWGQIEEQADALGFAYGDSEHLRAALA